MTTILIGILTACAFIGILLMLVMRPRSDAKARSVGALGAQLRADGLRLRRSWRGGLEIDGVFYGVEIHLESPVRAPLGGADKRRGWARIRVTAPVEDVLIREPDHHWNDEHPTGLQERTAPAALASRYSVFVSPRSASTGPFRDRPLPDPLEWVQPAIAEQFGGMKLVSLEVRRHNCEIYLAAVPQEAIYQALGLGANVARSASGRSLVPPAALTPGDDGRRTRWTRHLSNNRRRSAPRLPPHGNDNGSEGAS